MVLERLFGSEEHIFVWLDIAQRGLERGSVKKRHRHREQGRQHHLGPSRILIDTKLISLFKFSGNWGVWNESLSTCGRMEAFQKPRHYYRYLVYLALIWSATLKKGIYLPAMMFEGAVSARIAYLSLFLLRRFNSSQISLPNFSLVDEASQWAA